MKKQTFALVVLAALAAPSMGFAGVPALVDSRIDSDLEHVLFKESVHIIPVHLMGQSALEDLHAFNKKVAASTLSDRNGVTFFASVPDSAGNVGGFAETKLTPDGLSGGVIQTRGGEDDGRYFRSALTIPATAVAPSSVKVINRGDSAILTRTFSHDGSETELTQYLMNKKVGDRNLTQTFYSQAAVHQPDQSRIEYGIGKGASGSGTLNVWINTFKDGSRTKGIPDHEVDGKLHLPLEDGELPIQYTIFPSGQGSRINVKTSKGWSYTYVVETVEGREGEKESLTFKQVRKVKLADGVESMAADLKSYSPRTTTEEPVIKTRTKPEFNLKTSIAQ